MDEVTYLEALSQQEEMDRQIILAESPEEKICPDCGGKGVMAPAAAPELDPPFCKTCNGTGLS